MDMTCPKCAGPMRTYERNGVHVDQCADCRGIFLDRGELERLVDAENAWHGSAGHSGPAAPAAAAGGLGAVVGEVLGRGQRQQGHGDRRYDGDRYDDDRYRDHRYDKGYDKGYDQYGRPRRKKSFLDQLFD
jgi:Zn-finger nucleic acid-binding protein